MLYLLKRHPLPIKAEFGHCLVLTYALPAGVLQPLIPPGLEIDQYKEYGFVAVATVQTCNLRPSFLPPMLGRDFFLTGYRIFTKLKTNSGKTLRGLRILRSDTNRGFMSLFGTLLTHYNYHKVNVHIEESGGKLEIVTKSPDSSADLHVIADLDSKPAPLPEDSPFEDLAEARKYSGPLPHTFSYEEQTNSIISVLGIRKEWDPQPVTVEVKKNSFLEQAPFNECSPTLANAFHMRGVPYRWERGVRYPLSESGQ